MKRICISSNRFSLVRSFTLLSLVGALTFLTSGMDFGLAKQSGGLLGVKPATQQDSQQTAKHPLALDQKNWKRPQAGFKWIAMARDIATPWDTFGRQGWMTDDAYVEPVDPGVSEFPSDTEAFYIVFSIPPLDAPSQYRAAWYYMPDGKTPEPKPVGTDALFLEMNEKSGYLEVFKPEGGWKKGKYLLKLFYESPGQDLYEGNVIGTMEFTITE
ncbi:MAG: hypothetical protein D6704_02350 [Nitrospirae bacterium]|nr:MAG: hypothetical protein D6704_02350 [Nitrospirota bacterium]